MTKILLERIPSDTLQNKLFQQTLYLQVEIEVVVVYYNSILRFKFLVAKKLNNSKYNGKRIQIHLSLFKLYQTKTLV